MAYVTRERFRITTDGAHGPLAAAMVSFDGLAFEDGLVPSLTPIPTLTASEDLLGISETRNSATKLGVDVSVDDVRCPSTAGKFHVRK